MFTGNHVLLDVWVNKDPSFMISWIFFLAMDGRRPSRNIDWEDQFDSDLWELDDPMHGVEGIFFQTGLWKCILRWYTW